MTNQTQIIAATDEQIPFADLYLSDINPRSVVNDEAIERLAANIRQLGLIQNPAGLRDATGKVGIVAGGRRYRALALLQDDPRFQIVTVRMAPDPATAVFVGEADYTAAGGRIGGDLFADVTTFDDPAILDEVFANKLARTAADYPAAHGWKWAEAITDSCISYQFDQDRKFGKVYPVEGELTEAEAERYDALEDLANGDALDEEGTVELDALQTKMDVDFTAEQRAAAGVVIYVTNDGSLRIEAGFIKAEDKAAAIESGIMEPSRHATTEAAPKSPISDTLRGDLERIGTGARQNAMLDDPKLALHLLAFQLCGKMGYDRAYGVRTDDVPNVPTTETGYVLDKRLTVADTDDRSPFNRDHAAEFAKFRKRGDAKIMDLLNRYLVSQLSIRDSGFGAMIDKLTSKRTRETFTPTAENFFGRVNGAYLNDLWSDLLGLAADHPTVTTFAKLKKGEKAAKLESLFAHPATRTALGLSEDQIDRINARLPEGMA